MYNSTSNLVTTFSTGHIGSVNWLKRINATRYASASYDFTIKIWNSKTGSLITTILGHTGFVNYLELLDNNRLASCSSDFSIRVWDLSDFSLAGAVANAHGVRSILCLRRISSSLLASGSTGSGVFLDGPNLKVKYST